MTPQDRYPLVSPGCWAQRATTRNFAGRPAIFLDRDGVIVEETKYLGRAEDVRIIPGVPEAIASANASHIPVVVVTNQAGIAYGLYGWDGFAAVQACVAHHLALAGAHVDAIIACAYHHAGRDPYRVADHPWRKPSAGMLMEASRLLDIDLGRSVLIGDTITDIKAAQAAGLPQAGFVLTGHGEQQWQEHAELLANWPGAPVFSVQLYRDAAAAIRPLLASLLTGA